MMDGSKIYLPQDGIPSPQIQLYSQKEIHLEWKKTHKIGAGLVNLGNTCFMNTVIQCLTYCPPLANYLLHDNDHVSECKIVGFCMMCELQKHMAWTLDRPGEVVKPLYIYQKLKSIAKHFQFGRQEDAHEFLCYVVDNLWRASLFNIDGNVKLDSSSKENTVVNHIFGGYYRSQVLCLHCRERSNTYDHFMDIIVDIKNIHSLEKALEKFVQPELLQNDNAYRCPKCKMKVSAQKRFTVHRAPNVATFQFRRFHYNQMLGGKITKHVIYPEKLNLRPYMSDTKGVPVIYRLNAVLVHMGSSCNSGHYFCYVRNSNGLWYIMDDARVQQVSLNQVLNQQAYVLFYIKTSREIKKPHSACLLNHSLLTTVEHSTHDKYTHQSPSNCSSKSSRFVKQLSGPTLSNTSSTASVNDITNGTTYTKEPLPLTPQQKREKDSIGSQKLNIRKDKNPGASDSKLISQKMTGLVPHAENSSQSFDNEKSCENRNKQTKIHSITSNFPSKFISSIEKTQTLPEDKLPIEKERNNDGVNFNKNNFESEILTHKPDYLHTESSIGVKATSLLHVSNGGLYSPPLTSGSTTNWDVTNQQDFLHRSKGNRVVTVWKDTLNELETLADKPSANNCVSEKGKLDSGQFSISDLPNENKANVNFHHQTAESNYPISIKDVKTLAQHNNEKSKELCLRLLTQDLNDKQQDKEKDKIGEFESVCKRKSESKGKCELYHSYISKHCENDFPTCSKEDTHLLHKKHKNKCCLDSEDIHGYQQDVDRKQTNKISYHIFTEQSEQSSEDNNFTCLHREQKVKIFSNVDLSQNDRNLQSESKLSQFPLTETSERHMKLNSNQNFLKQSSIYNHECTESNHSQEKTDTEYRMYYTCLSKNQQNYCNMHKEYLKQDSSTSDTTACIKTTERRNGRNQSQTNSSESNNRTRIETVDKSESGYKKSQSRVDSSDNESNTNNKPSEKHQSNKIEAKVHTYDSEGSERSHSNIRRKQSKEDSVTTASSGNGIDERFSNKQGKVKQFRIKSSDIKTGDSYEEQCIDETKETLEKEKKETIQSNNQNVNRLEKNLSQLGQIVYESTRYKQQDLQNDERCEKGKVKNMKKRHFDTSFSYSNLFQKLYNHKRERKDHHFTESHKHHHGDLNHRMDHHSRLRHTLSITFNFGGKQKYR
ncbi:ubiquitin carboxyl-terminal hydrolase 36-like isoform X2 [Limulus polyphemus]|uniref:Ubiquitin carboxyl-terminal hydrolase 36 n=1 Tax=Limulus polyphemus TaxID=6850 RepID=A0ABM1B4D2_LIMPO|nr:ubiquitin carboxyl-terminal hydrolase 36-like isoform X2 [Limulus polyphemus]